MTGIARTVIGRPPIPRWPLSGHCDSPNKVDMRSSGVAQIDRMRLPGELPVAKDMITVDMCM